MLLNDLAKVDWGQLTAVNSPAVEMPCWITGLTSANAEIRSGSFDRLSTSIFHQGDVTEVTSHVVPFLIELLPDLETELKARTLSLLSGLASTNENEAIRSKMPADQKAQFTWIDYEKASQEQRILEEETYAAIRTGIPVIQSLTSHENQRVAEAAQHLMAHFR